MNDSNKRRIINQIEINKKIVSLKMKRCTLKISLDVLELKILLILYFKCMESYLLISERMEVNG